MSLKLLQPVAWKQRLARVAALCAGVIAGCSFLDLRGFGYLEHYFDDMRMSVYAAQHGSFEQWAQEHIVILTISDDSFRDTNPQRLPVPGPPVPRSYHARIINDLTRAGAKVIAFDLMFAIPRAQDKEMAAAARASGRVLWACRFQNDESESGSGRRLVLPVEPLLRANPHRGHINAPKDPELLSITRIPAVILHRGEAVPAFSVQAALMFLGLENQPLRRVGNTWQAGSLSIPVEGEDSFRIKYLGTQPGEAFPSLPYESIYNGWLHSDFYQQQRDNPRISMRDKIVLVGDTTTLGHDRSLTPLKEMSGIEIHAHAIATLLQGSFVRPASQMMNFMALCLLTMLVSAIAATWRSQWAVLATLGLLIGYFTFNMWLFVERGVSLHLVAPSIAMILATLSVVTERSLTVEREKNRACALLQRYVSPQIANYVLAHPEKCLLGGTRVTATVLFSDIRGFTALSEKMTPEEVLTRLNEYLQAMTDVVFRYDGTVDKYIGDAIMAIFGAPVPHADHAQRAVSAAIDMQSALLELQTKWRAEGLPLIDIGIGINTGEMVFGNMGANERMDFSVLGDAVNTASRVESLNKELHSRILATDSTYELVKGKVQARGPLAASVKGKDEQVIVHEIFGWLAVPHP